MEIANWPVHLSFFPYTTNDHIPSTSSGLSASTSNMNQANAKTCLHFNLVETLSHLA